MVHLCHVVIYSSCYKGNNLWLDNSNHNKKFKLFKLLIALNSRDDHYFQMIQSLAVLLLWAVVPGVWTQSNYDTQGNSIEYDPNSKLTPDAVLGGKVTRLDDIRPDIALNRTQAFLDCSEGSMNIKLTFKEPFYGVVYADFDRNSACMVKGRGLNYTFLELPLKG